MAGELSYANVRDYVTSKAGAACDGLLVEQLMQSTLQDFWNRLEGLEAEVSATVTTVADQADYSLGSSFERVLRVLDAQDCSLPAHVPSCGLFPCGCEGSSDWFTSYKLTGTTTITLLPTPDEAGTVYRVYGLRYLDITLYDMDGLTKVWRLVALPQGLHLAYAQQVLARAMVDTDPGRAQMWLGMSNSDFDSWRSRQRRGAERDQVVAGRQALKWWGRQSPAAETTYQKWTG